MIYEASLFPPMLNHLEVKEEENIHKNNDDKNNSKKILTGIGNCL